MHFVRRRRVRQAQAASDATQAGRSQAFDKPVCEDELYDELDEAKIQTQSQRDNRPRSVANVYQDLLHQSRMSAGDAQHGNPDITNGYYSDLNSATREPAAYAHLQRQNQANYVNQAYSLDTFTGGQQ